MTDKTRETQLANAVRDLGLRLDQDGNVSVVHFWPLLQEATVAARNQADDLARAVKGRKAWTVATPGEEGQWRAVAELLETARDLAPPVRDPETGAPIGDNA